MEFLGEHYKADETDQTDLMEGVYIKLEDSEPG